MFLNIHVYMINTTTCSFSCEFKIKLCSEAEARKWVSDYNEVTKETMVYTRSKRHSGKHVVTKLFMKCHHNQHSTGKHCKSTKKLKTTFKEHNDKHTSCPAQMSITILAAEGNYFRLDKGFMVLVSLNHQHNHPIHAADALRFRSISQDTKETYWLQLV